MSWFLYKKRLILPQIFIYVQRTFEKMSTEWIVKKLTDTDTCARGSLILPGKSTKEEFISRMNEDLQKIAKGKDGLKVILTDENGNTKNVSFRIKKNGYTFIQWYDVVQSLTLKTGDEVRFQFKEISDEILHVDFRTITNFV